MKQELYTEVINASVGNHAIHGVEDVIMKVFFATRNNGKVDYVKKVTHGLDGLTIVQYPLSLPETQSCDVEKVASDKVKFAFNEINNSREKKVPCIALDSGLYIAAFNGWPGTLIKSTLDAIKVEGLLKLVQGKPRECEIKPCLAYWDGNLSEPLTFPATIKGKITEEPKGETKLYHWSDFARIFIPEGFFITEAEMNIDTYEGWRKKQMFLQLILLNGSWKLNKNNFSDFFSLNQ